MFIQIIRGRVNDAAAIHEATNRWQAELKSGAKGYLGGTSGVADDGTFIAVVRFESEEAARTNSEHHEQRAWWGKMSKLFYSTPSSTIVRRSMCTWAGARTTRVRPARDPHRGGGHRCTSSRRQGVREARAPPPGSHRGHDGRRRRRNRLRHELLTSEAQARDGERKEIPTEVLALIRRVAELTEDVEYLDLRDPWLYSNAEQGKP